MLDIRQSHCYVPKGIRMILALLLIIPFHETLQELPQNELSQPPLGQLYHSARHGQAHVTSAGIPTIELNTTVPSVSIPSQPTTYKTSSTTATLDINRQQAFADVTEVSNLTDTNTNQTHHQLKPKQVNESSATKESNPWPDEDDSIETTASPPIAPPTTSKPATIINQFVSTTAPANQPFTNVNSSMQSETAGSGLVNFSNSAKSNSSPNLSSTPNNYSTFHPLLIYSIRYEIRSYDLYNGPHRPSGAHVTSLAPYDQHQILNGLGKHSRTLVAGLKNTIGLDFYYSDEISYLFWTDVIEDRIYRGVITNGSITGGEMIVQSGLATAEGLAVDWIGLNLYWVESTLDHIEVASLNGTSRRTLIAGDMESPRAIAVDPRYGLLFWTDWDKKSPRIERATMCGEDRKTLIYIKEVNGGWPNGLTLDYESLKIYWIDANSDSIHIIDYEGNNHQPLLNNIKSLGHPFSITLYENNLYWTDWKTNSVSMASKHNGSDAKELQRLTTRIFDIKVFHPNRQPRISNDLNPCFINNGNCSHLCLLSLNHTRECECPNLMKLDLDGITCKADEYVLLIGRINEIRAVDLDNPLHHIMAPISVPKVSAPKQFEFHAKTKTIFWADSHTNEVKRAQLAGTYVDTIIDVIIESPHGLALDWISGNIFVTSLPQHKSLGKIFISNLNGEYISILMDDSHGIVSPKSIVIHPTLGLLFCIDESNNGDPILFMSNMDGSSKRLIETKLVNPSNLAIDFKTDRVYWINQAINSSESASIQYYDINEKQVITFLNEKEVAPSERIYPSVLSVDDDYLIVSGRVPSEEIIKISMKNPFDRTTLSTQNLDQIYALRVYNPKSQVGSNACSLNNGGCSQLCVPNSPQTRVCKCTMGYSINLTNETECIGRDLFLIFSNNQGMKGISLNPNQSIDDYYLPPIHRAFRASSIDYVHRDNLIYWVDNDEGSITRINRDTTNYQVIVQGLESEESIAIDWVAGNIYWLDPYYDIIEVAHLNGSNRYVIVSDDMDKANGIVVNPIKGYIAWSDIGSIPKIETAKMDGSHRRTIVKDIFHIDDLALDYQDDYLYWVDSSSSTVERVKPDGTGRQLVYTGGPPNQGLQNHLVSIALYKDYLFVADSIYQQGSIIRCDKNNGSRRRIIQPHLGDGLKDISIFAEQRIPTPEDNPCVKDNGGCQDLCIFMGQRGQKKCICSHGKLKPDGSTCQPYDTFILYSKLSQIDSLHIKDEESFSNSPYQPITIENRGSIISLTVDYPAKRIIYSEMSRDQICSVHFNGNDRRVILDKQSSVEGIAFANDQLYWTSLSDNSISRYQTTSSGVPKKICDGSDCKSASVEKIVRLSLEDKPRGIAIDTCTNYIYWTNWNTNASIQRASPHTNYKVESIIKTNIKVPNGIAIDQKQRKLYWCDARLDKIEVCDMDGTHRLILISALPQHPFALAIWDNYVFWTDWLAKGVFKADKYTGQSPVQIKKVSLRPMGIAVASPEVPECSVDKCSFNNGGCPTGHTCIMHYSDSNPSTAIECRPNEIISHDVTLPFKPKCKLTKDGLCEGMTYYEILRDMVDRYKLTFTVPLDPNNSTEQLAATTIHPNNQPIAFENSTLPTTQLVTPTRPFTPILPGVIPTVQRSSNNSRTSSSTTAPVNISEPPINQVTRDTNNSKILPKHFPGATFKNTSYPNASNIEAYKQGPIASSPKSSYNVAANSSSGSNYNGENEVSLRITTTTPMISTTPSQLSTTTTPCQIVPAALTPVTELEQNNGCKLQNQFKCFLSSKLPCIPNEKRCDGNYDCPNREDEAQCYVYTPRVYAPAHQQDPSWHRFVTVILIILVAALAAMFLVFGNRNRRRWFVGTNGAFTHRRMFDDNGTNIEISNPMFDEDDPGNLIHCAFSIDLNERTTNFSNPLYERQVLLMNDKNVTTN